MSFPANIDLSSLDGSTGFKLSGVAANDLSGLSVASAGDVNGDGFADLIVGAPGAGPQGASYVVFGAASGFSANLDLSNLDGSTGFKLRGVAAGDGTGWSAASAGDVNGDGFDDLIVGARYADPNGSSSGTSYVVFGKASGFDANVDLSSLDGSTGFRLHGFVGNDGSGSRSGWSVASAGDVNGDGFADLIVSAPYARLNGDLPGQSYVVFGKASGFAANLDLSSLNGSNGFKLNSATVDERSGGSVASAGDVNGDGFADLIVGSWQANTPASNSGASYVIFGKASGFAANLNLSTLDGSNGFKLRGVKASDSSGFSVASAGDVNGDGFADLIVGAPNVDAHGLNSGASYVVFGKASGFAADLDLRLDGSNGFKLSGERTLDRSGFSVASAGDFNGDGFADLIVGAFWADPNGVDGAGASYVVFGKATGFTANINLSSLNGTNGFKLSGEATSDYSGRSVAAAGDVNGDGFDDLIVGADSADPHGSASGASYVVFGGAFGATVTTNGTAAAEMLIGGTGDDALNGGGGADSFHGGAGDDDLTIGDLAFRLVDGGTGSDTLLLGGAGLTLDLTDRTIASRVQGIERIDLAGSGDNTLRIDRLGVRVGLGAVSGGLHVLTVLGDAGDTVLADREWFKTSFFTNADGTFDRYMLGVAILDVEQGVAVPGATIDGTAGNDTISLSQTVAGQPFATNRDDVINGHDGDDTISGAHGADTLTGGDGDDTVSGDAGNDTIRGQAGNDRLTGGADNDILNGGLGNDTLSGGSGSDTASYASASAGVKVSLALAGPQNTLGDGNDTLNDIENLTGSDFADTLTGNAGTNTLNGLAGDDLLDGGAGNDTLNGGNGIDTATYASAAGAVKVSLLLAGQQNTLGAGKDTLSSIEDLTGSGFADTLTGGAGANLLMGGNGDDTLDGNAGADTLNGGAGFDTASYASAGAGVTVSLSAPAANTGDAAGDTYASIENLTGSQFADVLTGAGGANTLNGGKGADQINGGAGIDRLLGGGGLDTLIGGSGVDTFVFDQALVAGNVATVVDFAAGGDRMELALAIFGAAGPAGALAAGAFRIGAAAADADDRIIYNAATGALLYDADGVGGTAAKTFAMAGTGLAITANNFVLA